MTRNAATGAESGRSTPFRREPTREPGVSNLAIIAEAFAETVDGWHADDVLGKLNMTEGHKMADLLDALGFRDTADHVLREVWEAEDEDCRDPHPWVARLAIGWSARYATEREALEFLDDNTHIGHHINATFDPRRDFDADN